MIDPFWKQAHRLYQRRFPHAARLFEIISMSVSSHAVSAQISVGEGTRFYHHALGCVALQTVHIGKNCMIFQNVTFGNRYSPNDRKSATRGGGGTALLGITA